MNALLGTDEDFKDFHLSGPIRERLVLQVVNRAVDEDGILTRQKNGTILSYGIAGEKSACIDLTADDPLESGAILGSIVNRLLTIRRNEGKPRGFLLEEIVQEFEANNKIKYPQDKTGDGSGTLLRSVITSALKKGNVSGHIRTIGKEHFVTGKKNPQGVQSSSDPFSSDM